jgi:hypothetical protein
MNPDLRAITHGCYDEKSQDNHSISSIRYCSFSLKAAGDRSLFRQLIALHAVHGFQRLFQSR